MTDNHPPYPRLWHCKPGSRVVLLTRHGPEMVDKKTPRVRTITHFQGRHAVMADGLIVTQCHLVARECMQFGDGAGWRPLINTNGE